MDANTNDEDDEIELGRFDEAKNNNDNTSWPAEANKVCYCS